jgi:hypothetical protein
MSIVDYLLPNSKGLKPTLRRIVFKEVKSPS